MPHSTCPTHASVSIAHHNRRTVGRALAGLGLLTLLPRSAASVARAAAAPPYLAGETYVGVTTDPETLVAIVVDKERAIAYLCDGLAMQTECWFSGTVKDGMLRLMTSDGAALAGTRTASGIGGGATLSKGRSVTFMALPATGAAGLYTAQVTDSRVLTGGSSAGGLLEGEWTPGRARSEYLPSLDSPAEGMILGSSSPAALVDGRAWFASRITTPEGRVLRVRVVTETDEPGRFSLILLPDGVARGQGLSASGQRMNPVVLPAR